MHRRIVVSVILDGSGSGCSIAIAKKQKAAGQLICLPPLQGADSLSFVSAGLSMDSQHRAKAQLSSLVNPPGLNKSLPLVVHTGSYTLYEEPCIAYLNLHVAKVSWWSSPAIFFGQVLLVLHFMAD